MPKSTINLKQLSQHLGLSQTTVSRALNGFPEVNENTRQKVLAAAAQFNYRPSPSASSLATGKTRIIGHVVPISEHKMINPHFADFLAGASEAYSAAGYDLLLRTATPKQEEEIYREFASRNRVDGVVVHGPLIDEPRIEVLKSIRLPFIVHGRTTMNGDDYSWLDVDNATSFRRLTQHLIDLGHKRIALVNGLETMNFAHRRLQGYREAMETNQLEMIPKLISSADMNEPYGYNATLRMLDCDTPPSAILYSSILSAMGGMRATGERGLRVPQDISLATFDDELSFLQTGDGQPREPFFTGMHSSIQEAGKKLGQMLINQISNPASNAETCLWESKLIVGKTTGPRPRENS